MWLLVLCGQRRASHRVATQYLCAALNGGCIPILRGEPIISVASLLVSAGAVREGIERWQLVRELRNER